MGGVLFAQPTARGPKVAREETWAGQHPDPLPSWLAGPGCELVVDPMAEPIRNGDPLLGWAGDTRLALYANWVRGTWQLWRREHDGQYRMVTQRGMAEARGPELVVSLINALVAHDTRRGFDPHTHVVEQNEALDRAVGRHWDDRHSELNDKLRWALHRDGADDHCTGLPLRAGRR